MQNMPSLQELVNQAQTDRNKLSKALRDIQDVINVYPGFLPDQRRRLLNVIRQRLEGVQAGSPPIDVAELEKQVKKYPDLGDKPHQPDEPRNGFILPY
jgi:hypothetical protein